MNAVVVVLFTASALIIHECYSMEETAPSEFKDQCANLTCRRTVDHLGRKGTSGCPKGCLCVIKGRDTDNNATGSCYLLRTTTPEPTTASG
uniref:Putative evasin n=1 Tax=Rhipicephalus microplus TaxID=6941 RepID=A0A6G5A850_RHIMP